MGGPVPARAAAALHGSVARLRALRPLLVDRRGLTAAGAAVLLLVLGAAGGSWDVATGPGLRTAFAVCFVLGCAVAALVVHREDLRAAVVMPPLVFAVLSLLAGAVDGLAVPGGFAVRQGVQLANALSVGAPVVLSGAALALAVVAARAVWRAQPSGMPADRRSRRSSGGSANSSDSRADSTSCTSP
jgi:hypothetical protein